MMKIISLNGLNLFMNRETFAGDDSREVVLPSSFWKRESREGPMWRRFFLSSLKLDLWFWTGGAGVKKPALTGGFTTYAVSAIASGCLCWYFEDIKSTAGF